MIFEGDVVAKQKTYFNVECSKSKCNHQKTIDGEFIYRLGEKCSGTPARRQIQDFQTIQKQCLKSGILFEDPDFPADDSSLILTWSHERRARVKWLRPKEITKDPQFLVEGFSRFDVVQGELGNCWFLAAAANLTLNQKLFSRVVPLEQNFAENYAGVFHFHFWQYGKWVEVVIDDRLPTYRGNLFYIHSSARNEFWSALLEKAYAKLQGSYASLVSGKTCEAMVDFTGGVTEIIETNLGPPNTFNILMKAYERNSMIACSIEMNAKDKERETPEGLMKGHAYSLTRVEQVNVENSTKKIQLIRLRNPWGNDREWKGPWSDRSTEWNNISEELKQKIELTFDNDGEFWMCYDDFKNNFDHIEICNLSPNSLSEEHLDSGKKKWEMSLFEGEWTSITAGGCYNFPDTFFHNPQYVINLDTPDENDENGFCTVICNLIQKHRRIRRNTNTELLSIGYTIYPVSELDLANKPLTKDFFQNNYRSVGPPSFINLRQVTCRFSLPAGQYVIVPSTFRPKEEGEFILRVFSECKNQMEINDEEFGVHEENNNDGDSVDVAHDSKVGDMERLFINVSGLDGEVDWMELKELLDRTMNEFCKEGFSKDVCRSLIAMMDSDKSGKLGFEDFRTLMNNIKKWCDIFKQYDQDNSGSFDAFELRAALNTVGYRLNNRLLNALFHRYGSRDGMVYFEDFLMCAIKMKTMVEIFKQHEIKGSNMATFNMEEWIERTVYS